VNRREVVRRAVLLAGSAISSPAILGLLQGCAKDPGPDWKPSVLTKEEIAVVSPIADIILPRTDTPGALDVGVPAFIDTILKEVYSQEDRDHYVQGLHAFDAGAQETHGRPFASLEPGLQKTLVQRSHAAAIADERAANARKWNEFVQEVRNASTLEQRTEPPAAAPRRSFIMTTKELALLRFFTSQPGATQVLQYVAIPGAYHGCLPVSQAGNGKRWAT
jgi:gluconate 2-dehydrogenase gamma chain